MDSFSPIFTTKGDFVTRSAKNKRKPIEISIVQAAEAEIRAQLAVIAKRRAAKKLPTDELAKLSLCSAALMRSAVSAEGERRQREKAAVKSIATIPLDQVVAYLKTLPAQTRDDVCREISGADDEESLL